MPLNRIPTSMVDGLDEQLASITQFLVPITLHQDKAVAQSDGNLDWKPVFDYIDSLNMIAYVPVGTWNIYSRLTNKRIVGGGREYSVINQKTSTEPVIELNGEGLLLTDVTLQHGAIPSYATNSNGVGINIIFIKDGSVIERVLINNVTSGIYLDDSNGGHIYSTSIRDVRVTRFNRAGIYIGGSGHTGNVFENVYLTNWDDYSAGTLLTSDYGFYFKGINEGVYEQLNIEHGNYKNGIVVNNDGNFNATSIHFEGYVATGNYNGLFFIDGSGTKNVNIKGVTVIYSTFDNAKASNYSFMVVNYTPKIKIDGLYTENNTITNAPTLRKFYGGSTLSEGAKIDAQLFTMVDNLFSSADYFPSTFTPVVRRYNEKWYYREENGNRVFFGTLAPTSGTYNTGDRVINTGISSLQNTTSHWVCRSGGTPGVWHAYGVGEGTTTARPTLSLGDRGFSYFDTTLNKFVYWNGSSWLG